MQSIPIVEVDGRRLYYMFVAGAHKVIENQVRLNRINVFPVRDGDTGANMAATLRSVLESVQPDRSYKRMVDLIAETTLLNARGNSGIIFAQFLYGVSYETAELQAVSLDYFAESLMKAVRYMYKAVANPVEGTMLTIIRAWAECIYSYRNTHRDFITVFLNSKVILETTLANTTSQLPVLEKANVVDAGAGAFVYFIEGIIDCIHGNTLKHLIKMNSDIQVMTQREGQLPEDEQIPEFVEFRYCTEAIIRNVTLEHDVLSKLLQQYGNSVVLAGAEKASRLHIHTNHPAQLFDELREYGTITFQKADDMLRQSQAAYHRKWKIALVTDSACDLSQDLFDRYQIHMLPINMYFGENHYLDKITMLPEQFYRRLDNGGDYPKTAQVSEIGFRNLYAHLASHYDAIVAVHLSAKFSGTYFNSQKAAETIRRELGVPITVIDSKNLSGALGLIVLRIAHAIEHGDSYEEIVGNAEQWVGDSRIFVSVRTLKYMVKGGRVSPLKGFIANMLNLNPIVSMDEHGQSMLFGKTFSQRSNMEKVIKHIQHLACHKTIWNYIVLHADNKTAANWYAKNMQDLFAKSPVSKVNISPVIGAHAGVGAASVALMFD